MKVIKTARGHEVEDFLDFVPVPAGRSGRLEVSLSKTPRRAKIQTSSLRTSLFGGDEPDHVQYPKATAWRALREEGVGTWMTDLPIEQSQARAQMAPLRQARSILVGGLGLGIAARIALRARGIERVVVVEKNQHVIRLVEPALRGVPELSGPLAPSLEVVRADLFDYLKGTRDEFGWAFFDIWQSDGEGTFHQQVVPLRELAQGRVVPVGRVVCWNEHVMRGQLAQGLRTRLLLIASGFAERTGMKGVPTLKELAEPADSIWWDWSVPFFRWVLEVDPDQERAMEAAVRYAHSYGDGPAWLERWREVA